MPRRPTNEARNPLLALQIASASAFALLLTLWAIVLYQNEQAELVRGTLEVQQLVSDFRNGIQAEESTQRGFLLTGNGDYLEMPRLPIGSPREGLVLLRERMADNPTQATRVDRLEEYLEAKLAELARTKALVAEGRRGEALEIVNGDRGKFFMDRIDATLAQMRATERELLHERTADSEASLRWVYGVLAVAILVLGYSLFKVHGEVGDLVERLAAERERYREADGLKEVEMERRARLERYNEILIANLEERNRALDRYAYVTSHDLQQPLRTISGVIDALQEDFPDLTRGEAGEYLDMVASGASRMHLLVSGLLKKSREGNEEEAIPLDPESMLAEVIRDLAQLIAERGATVTHGGLPFLIAPPTGLRLLLQNLITNAIKYAAPGRRPEVHVESHPVAASPSADGEPGPPSYRITVRDNGRGIAPDRIREILEYGHRGDSEDVDGHGLGLTACVQVARALGGELEVGSELGVGSRFSFTARGAIVREEVSTTP